MEWQRQSAGSVLNFMKGRIPGGEQAENTVTRIGIKSFQNIMEKDFSGLSSALNEEMNGLNARLQNEGNERELDVVKRLFDVKAEVMPDLSDEINKAMLLKNGVRQNICYIVSSEIVRLLDGTLWCPRYVLDDRADKEMYVYAHAYWAKVPNQLVYDFINECAQRAGIDDKDLTDPHFMSIIYNRVMFSVAKSDYVDMPKDETWVNLLNGTLVIKSDGSTLLREHRREDKLTYVLPYAYDPLADCERFKAFLAQMLPDESIHDMLAQYVGYVFTRDVKLEKMLVLYGKGSNGKSVLIEVLTALFGRENVSEVPLNDLTNEDLKRTLIENKLLNLSSENIKELNPAVLKSLVSGEPVMGKKLYSDPYTIYNYAKLIASFNRLPTAENTHGYFRRLIIVPFNVTISDDEADVDLPRKLCEELPGILNWAIDGLKRFLQHQRLSVPEPCRQAMTRYMKMADNVHMFFDEMCKVDSIIKTAGPDLYKAYRSYCLNDGLKPVGKINFYDRLEGLGVQRTEYQRNILFNVILSNDDRPF